MQNKMAPIDPEWAWSTFEPKAGVLNERQVAHLYRRAGFGASETDITRAQKQNPEQLAQQLAYNHEENSDFERDANGLAQTLLGSGNAETLSAAWVYRMMHTPNQLLEKTTLFWHGHFATSASKVQDVSLMWQQSKLLRQHALGEFPTLVHKIAQDPAMLIYLDSATNRKSHPNENFARELMELFCLGEGHYSEKDVQELAKCFTGWEIKNRRFRKNRYQQDLGEKTVLGTSGKMDGEEAIDVVLAQEETANFVVRKLVRFFVCDEPDLPTETLAPLAGQFRRNGLQIAPIVARILSSNLFYSDYAQARKIRSPVELNLGVLRALEATTNTVELAQGMKKLGQGLFYPPNVKGWDGGRTWINSATLLGRANLLDQWIQDDKTKFAGGSLSDFFSSKNIKETQQIIDWLENRLFAVQLNSETKEKLLLSFRNASGPRESKLKHLLVSCCSLPEFQLG